MGLALGLVAAMALAVPALASASLTGAGSTLVAAPTRPRSSSDRHGDHARPAYVDCSLGVIAPACKRRIEAAAAGRETLG
jgi:hypothetical protein